MGQYTFDNLSGYTDFVKKAQKNDIIITTKNFGAGSSRQQAVDCFTSLGIACIVAESFGAIYERNAINAAMPVMTYKAGMIEELDLQDGDIVNLDFESGEIENTRNARKTTINPFYDAQLKIYQKGGLLG
jgi:3-isopropylmalate dehydratase small subunit